MIPQCMHCQRPFEDHAMDEAKRARCPDGSGRNFDFMFTVTKEGIDRLERTVANMKRLQSGEEFRHCPMCLSDVALATCPCGNDWCQEHIREHLPNCRPVAERDREPTAEERAWAAEHVEKLSDELRQEAANRVFWMLVMDSTIQNGYVTGPRVHVPRCKALQDALADVGVRRQDNVGAEILFAKERT